MDCHSRDGRNANSALLVGVEPSDFDSEDPLAGVEFQRKWERAAFEAGGGNYFAPAQTVGDFLADVPSKGPGSVTPTYRPGVKWTDITRCLPAFAAAAMREALSISRDPEVRGYEEPDELFRELSQRNI